ncbi:flavoprotein [Sparassis latifolia]|uniref:NAD(P)H-dependent FMN reductase LOT6 n=1 Tax=Sparassis crispa TaxID=139825 RepID=A0A401G753_9APHY|nr:NAD(P)H-dependent FMN reductase LOT6 [Sparassis crispa]GBE77995.1 NAD(P)H-dependent FMN reductase LOT6 [Sparassis crispa]
MSKIALILGSSRTPSNGRGIASWLTSVLKSRFNNSPTPNADMEKKVNNLYRVCFVDPTVSPLPLGPIVDGSYMPSDIHNPDKYPSPAVQQWSTFVSSCAGFVVLSPQYNWGYPGELKNVFDHLYWEWRGKPVMLVTYGGHGGNKSATLLREVLGGGLKMKVLSKSVEITLPSAYIKGEEWVTGAHVPEFIAKHESSVGEALEEMLQLLSAKA